MTIPPNPISRPLGDPSQYSDRQGEGILEGKKRRSRPKRPDQKAKPTKRTAKKDSTPQSDKLTLHSDADKARALVAFREIGTVFHACTAAGIARSTWYDWIESDPAFAKAVIEVREGVLDELEKEAIKRAKNGSDTLIIFLLKSLRRNQYGDKVQLDVVHPEVRDRLSRQLTLIASNPKWDTEELLKELEAIWQ